MAGIRLDDPEHIDPGKGDAQQEGKAIP